MAENGNGLPAISLWQPWASLIAVGAKPYETRAFAPWRSLIGRRIAIHAAKKPIDPIWRDLDEATRRAMTLALWTAGIARTDDLPLGAVVCTAVLRGAYQMRPDGTCVSLTGEVGGIKADLFGDYSEGRWAWRLTDIERLDPPVPAKGRQGFWTWEPSTTPAPPLRAAAERGM